MKFLQNLYDPRREDAKKQIACWPGQSREAAWQEQKHRLADKIIGPPKATKACTVAELEEMGIVGIYVEERGGSDEPGCVPRG
jgi:hypothetical protein